METGLKIPPIVCAELPYFLRIGTRRPIKVRDLADASYAYQFAKDQSGKRGSTFPTGSVEIGGIVYIISVDGSVWHGENCILEAQ